MQAQRLPSRSSAAGRLLGALLACVVIVAGAAACGGAAFTPRPSPSLIILDFTPRPSASSSLVPSGLPTQAAWPIGWDVAFCEMFAEAIIAQQLVVDIERALDEGAVGDARLLSDELVSETAFTTELLGTLGDWPDGQRATTAIAALMEIGGRAGTEYQAYFADGKRAALRRARTARTENRDAVPQANEELAVLAGLGLSCPGTELVLEAP